MSGGLSPLKPFRFGSLRVEAEQPQDARSVPGIHAQGSRRRQMPCAPALSFFEGIVCDDVDGGDRGEESGSGDDSFGADQQAGERGSGDGREFDGRRRKVKRKASRIARPRDSMPGFKKGRGRSGGGGSGFRRPKSGTSTVGKKYLNRGMSVATYYGKEAAAGEEALGGTAGVVEAAGEEIGRFERELALSGPAVDIGVPRCTEHGLHCAKLKVKKRGPNKGRFFYKCAHPQRYQQCNFFVWEDEVASLKGHLGGDGEESSAEYDKVPPSIAPAVFTGLKRKDSGDDDCASDAQTEGCLEDNLLLALREVFFYKTFRPGQMDVMRLLCAGESALAVLPTGGGKSLCYQLFAAVTPGVVVVVTPLISLMLDQLGALPKSLPGACFRSGQTRAAMLATESKLLAGELKVLFVAPERLFTDRFQRLMRRLPSTSIPLVVVDEAHCISEMGHNFRTSFLRLESAIFGPAGESQGKTGLFPETAILAMTATATKPVIDDVCSNLHISGVNVVQADLSRQNLRLTLSEVDGSFESKAAELCQRLRCKPFASFVLDTYAESEASGPSDARQDDKAGKPLKSKLAVGAGPGWGKGGSLVVSKRKTRSRQSPATRGRPSKRSKTAASKLAREEEEDGEEVVYCEAPGVVIVYVSKQRECETVCNYLRSSRLSTLGKVDMYHAGMTLSARANVQRDFDKGNISVLVATVAFGMGLDSKDVRGVIHFDIPFSVEAYAQEIGRAGRDGRPAACHLFMNSFDACRLRSRAHSDGLDLGTVRQFLQKLFRCADSSTISRSEQKGLPKPSVASNSDDGDSSDTSDCGDSGDEDGGKASDVIHPCADSPIANDAPDIPPINEEDLASLKPGDTQFVHIPHRILEKELDLRPDACDTICTFLEQLLPGFTLLPSRPATLRLRFFSKSAAQLIEEKERRGLSDDARAVLATMMKLARHRNGMYELNLYPTSPSQAKDRPSGDRMLQVARELKAGKHVDFELSNEALAALVPAGLVGNATEMNEAAAKCHQRLCVIESVRRGKADALVAMLKRAGAMLSDEEQSRFIHEALAIYFKTGSSANDGDENVNAQDDDDDDVDDEGKNETKDERGAALRRAVRGVVRATAYGSRRARTPRQVARVLHGVQSPAFAAREWCRCAHWGKFVDVDFRDVLRAARAVVREMTLAGGPRAALE